MKEIKGNEIRVTGIPKSLYQDIKSNAKKNDRTMNKQVLNDLKCAYMPLPVIRQNPSKMKVDFKNDALTDFIKKNK